MRCQRGRGLREALLSRIITSSTRASPQFSVPDICACLPPEFDRSILEAPSSHLASVSYVYEPGALGLHIQSFLQLTMIEHVLKGIK